jgi:hypothetical protein
MERTFLAELAVGLVHSSHRRENRSQVLGGEEPREERNRFIDERLVVDVIERVFERVFIRKSQPFRTSPPHPLSNSASLRGESRRGFASPTRDESARDLCTRFRASPPNPHSPA